MTKKLPLININPDLLELATSALRGEAARRQRAATKAADELEVDVAEGTVTDRRPTSVRIVKMLAEAGQLNRFADELQAAFGDDNSKGGVADLTKVRAAKGRKTEPPAEPTAESVTEVEFADAPEIPLEVPRSSLDEGEVVDAIEASEGPEE